MTLALNGYGPIGHFSSHFHVPLHRVSIRFNVTPDGHMRHLQRPSDNAHRHPLLTEFDHLWPTDIASAAGDAGRPAQACTVSND
jgi:hypothetical protein